MWNDKKPWWQKKAKDNQTDCDHRKTWCVIKLLTQEFNTSTFVYDYSARYKAVAKSNAPKYYNYATGGYEAPIEVENLTKHEAHCVAKGLNFLDT